MSLTPCEYKTGSLKIAISFQGRKLGEGSYSVVREATHTASGKKYAVKIISKELMRGKEHMVVNEIAVLKRVSHGHKNILTLYDYFETPNNLYLVMELCAGGELFDRIYEKGYYFEADAANTLQLVLGALAYIHSQNLIYKSLNDDELVLADFGLSRIMDVDNLQTLSTRCGTPGYMSPEILRRIPYGKPVDMWSIGVLAYFLLCGYTPFDGGSPTDEISNIVKANYHFEPRESWQNISPLAISFIQACLLIDPTKRLTANEALKHPWIIENSTTNIEELQRNDSVKSIDLLPLLKEKFNAKRTFRKAVGVVRAVGKFNSFVGQSRESSLTNLSQGSSEELMVLVKTESAENESIENEAALKDVTQEIISVVAELNIEK